MKNTFWKIILIILGFVFFPLWPLTIAIFISYKIYKSDIQRKWLIIIGVVFLAFFSFSSWITIFNTSDSKVETNKEITTVQDAPKQEAPKLETKVEVTKPDEVKATEALPEETKVDVIPTVTTQPVNNTVTTKETTPSVVQSESTPPAKRVVTKEVESQPTKQSSESYACNCKKTCKQMLSCREAQYQLNTCGCSARDADHDGIACDSECQ